MAYLTQILLLTGPGVRIEQEGSSPTGLFARLYSVLWAIISGNIWLRFCLQDLESESNRRAVPQQDSLLDCVHSIVSHNFMAYLTQILLFTGPGVRIEQEGSSPTGLFAPSLDMPPPKVPRRVQVQRGASWAGFVRRQKGGMKMPPLLYRRWHLLPPFLPKEPGTACYFFLWQHQSRPLIFGPIIVCHLYCLLFCGFAITDPTRLSLVKITDLYPATMEPCPKASYFSV
jgi:hypothetical protein